MNYSEAAYRSILDSGWPTDRLAGFALTFATRYDAHRPVWQGVIGEDEAESRAYYRSIGWLTGASENALKQLRYEAAEALAMGGWDARTINFRMS
jgi:hypothetical protein